MWINNEMQMSVQRPSKRAGKGMQRRDPPTCTLKKQLSEDDVKKGT